MLLKYYECGYVNVTAPTTTKQQSHNHIHKAVCPISSGIQTATPLVIGGPFYHSTAPSASQPNIIRECLSAGENMHLVSRLTL